MFLNVIVLFISIKIIFTKFMSNKRNKNEEI